jgi:Nucleotidyltransferase domain
VKKVSVPGVGHYLRKAEIDLERIAEAGGGVWLFGSRAAGCARKNSDWDLLILTPSAVTESRRKRGNVDLVYVALADLQTWASSELAVHVETYGMRLDEGPPIQFNANPIAAAVRKQALVAVRSRFLDRIGLVLQPAQLGCELLRLRRNAHRGWLLAEGQAVPPTALLDRAWQAASERTRVAILDSCQMAPCVRDAALSRPGAVRFTRTP